MTGASRPRRPLGFKIHGLAVAVALLVALTVALASVTRFRDFGRDRLSRKALTVARMTAENSSFAVYAHSETELARIAQSLSADEEIGFVQFRDGNGDVLLERSFLPGALAPPAPSQSASDHAPSSEWRSAPGWGTVVEATAPAEASEALAGLESDPLFQQTVPSGPPGTVRVGLTLAVTQAELLRHLLTVALATVMALLAGLVLANRVTRRLTAPIAKLVTATHEVASGNLDTDIAVESQDELGALAADFGTMVATLRSSRSALQNSNRVLEERVAERTAALAATTEAAQELARRAEEASRAKSQFLANMSHEIRTPMNGVLGMTQLLIETPLSDVQRRYTNTISVSAESLLGVINDILDFSKVEAGRLELETLEFDLSELVGETCELLARRAHAKHLELLVDLAPGTPAQVIGDPNRLRQVLLNLVGNAVKFTEEGEVIVSVRPGPKRGSEIELVFEVRDTGIGITADERARLFQPFVQADGSMTRRFGGTGLGLAISRQLVQLMGGEIEVASDVGRGSCFRFNIKAPVASMERRDRDLVWRSLRNRKALVVDDNPTNLEVVSGMLGQWGLSVTLAASGAEALVHFASPTTFDIAILDMMMPEMDGLELANEIRTRFGPRAPRLVLLTSVDASRTAERTGLIDAWLTKPVRQSYLLDAIVGLLRPLAGRESTPVSAPVQRLPRVGATVLIVDDNPINRTVLQGFLERHSIVGLEAADGQEALAVAADHRVDLVFMDLQMPTMDGFATVEAWRRREGAAGATPVPIVAVTASALKGERERCLEAGMDDYLAKPYRSTDLEAILQRWLRAAGQTGSAGESDRLHGAVR